MMHADFAAFLKVLDGALNVAGVAAQDLSEACDRQAAQTVTVVGAEVNKHQDAKFGVRPRGAPEQMHNVGKHPLHEREEARGACQAGELPLAQGFLKPPILDELKDREPINLLKLRLSFGRPLCVASRLRRPVLRPTGAVCTSVNRKAILLFSL